MSKIPIIGEDHEEDLRIANISVEAIGVMVQNLTAMEQDGKSDKEMMRDCVWPILHNWLDKCER